MVQISVFDSFFYILLLFGFRTWGVSTLVLSPWKLPIMQAQDWRWQNPNIWQNEIWQGKPKYSRKSATMLLYLPNEPYLELNPATQIKIHWLNCLNQGMMYRASLHLSAKYRSLSHGLSYTMTLVWSWLISTWMQSSESVVMILVLLGLTCHQPRWDVYSAVEVSLRSPAGSHRLHHSPQGTSYVLLWEALLYRLQVSL